MSSLLREALVAEATSEIARLSAALPLPQRMPIALERPNGAFAALVAKLLSGADAHLLVVGSSPFAGAGGAGLHRTADHKLAELINALLERAERRAGPTARLGRLRHSNMAQGATSSYWASMLLDSLASSAPDLILWDFSITDDAIAVEHGQLVVAHTRRTLLSRVNANQQRDRMAAFKQVHRPYMQALGPRVYNTTVQYIMRAWLRRVHLQWPHRPPPAILMAYLWDKQPRQPTQMGQMWRCKYTPYPGSAFEPQARVLEHFAAAGASIAAINTAGWLNWWREHPDALSGGALAPPLCDLISDGYFHPSVQGHGVIANLLLLSLLRTMLADGAAAASLQTRALPELGPFPQFELIGESSLTARLAELKASKRTAFKSMMAWYPRVSVSRPEVDGAPPLIHSVFKQDPLRADRKLLWKVPSCADGKRLSFLLPSATVRALSFHGFAGKSTDIRHLVNGAEAVFEQAADYAFVIGRFHFWHLVEPSVASAQPTLNWSMCTPNMKKRVCQVGDDGWCAPSLTSRMKAGDAAVSWVHWLEEQ